MTTEEKLKVAQRAICTTLKRIGKDKDVAYKLGPGSQTFDELTAAFSELTGQPLEKIRNDVSPGSADFPHMTAKEVLEELC